MLSDRLMTAVEYTIDEAMEYRVFRGHMIHVDDNAHSRGVGPEPPEKEVAKVNRVSKTKENEKSSRRGKEADVCFNCNNDEIHDARHCKLNGCGYCEKFHCGHNSFNCPKRLKNRKGSSLDRDRNKGRPAVKEKKSSKYVSEEKEKERRRRSLPNACEEEEDDWE